MAKATGSNDKLKNQLAKKTGGEVAKKEEPKTISQWIEAMKPEIEKALPKHITADRITRIALTALRQNPKLAQCDATSLMAGIMQSAQLGLEPNTPLGEAYIIPYGKQAQFQVGYKGLISLAHRGNMKSIYAHEVYENDDFSIEYGLNQDLKHKPAMKNRGEVVGYYAVYHLANGGYGFEFMSKEDVEKHRDKFSPSAKYGSSPWKSDFDSMAKKTVIKKALKYAPISVEVQRVLQADESVKTRLDEDMSTVENNIYDVEPEYSVEDDTPKEEVKQGQQTIEEDYPDVLK